MRVVQLCGLFIIQCRGLAFLAHLLLDHFMPSFSFTSSAYS